MANEISKSIQGLSSSFESLSKTIQRKDREEELIRNRNTIAENGIQIATAHADLSRSLESALLGFDGKINKAREEAALAGETFDSAAFIEGFEKEITDPFESRFNVTPTKFNQGQVARGRSIFVSSQSNIHTTVSKKLAENQSDHLSKKLGEAHGNALQFLDERIDNGGDARTGYSDAVTTSTKAQEILGRPVVLERDSVTGDAITFSPPVGETSVQMSIRLGAARQTISSLLSASRFDEANEFLEWVTADSDSVDVADETMILRGVHNSGESYRAILLELFENETKQQFKGIVSGIETVDKHIEFLQIKHNAEPMNSEILESLKSYSNARIQMLDKALKFDSENPHMRLLSPEARFSLDIHRDIIVSGKIDAQTGRQSPSTALRTFEGAPPGQQAPALAQAILQSGDGLIDGNLVNSVIQTLETPFSKDESLRNQQIRDRINMLNELKMAPHRIPGNVEYIRGIPFASYLANSRKIFEDDIIGFATGVEDKEFLSRTIIQSNEKGTLSDTTLDFPRIAALIYGGDNVENTFSGERVFLESTISEQRALASVIRGVAARELISIEEASQRVDSDLRTQRDANVAIRPAISRFSSSEEGSLLLETYIVSAVANANGEVLEGAGDYREYSERFVLVPYDPYDPNNTKFSVLDRDRSEPFMENYLDLSEVISLRDRGVESHDQLMSNYTSLLDDPEEEIAFRDAVNRWNGKKEFGFFDFLRSAEVFWHSLEDDQPGVFSEFDEDGNPININTILPEARDDVAVSQVARRTRLNVLLNSKNVLKAVEKDNPPMHEYIVRLKEVITRTGGLAHVESYPDLLEELSFSIMSEIFVRASLVSDPTVGDVTLTPRDIRSVDLLDALPSEARIELQKRGELIGLSDALTLLYPEEMESDVEEAPISAFNFLMDIGRSSIERTGKADLEKSNRVLELNAALLGFESERDQSRLDESGSTQSQAPELSEGQSESVRYGVGRLSKHRFLTINQASAREILSSASREKLNEGPLIIATAEADSAQRNRPEASVALEAIDQANNGNLEYGRDIRVFGKDGQTLRVQAEAVDGDTFTVRAGSGEMMIIHQHMPDDTLSLQELDLANVSLSENQRIRVIGQDAPEVKKAWRGEPGEDSGNESYVFMFESTQGKEVYVQVYPTSDGKDLMKDHYGRVLGGLSVGGKDLTEASLSAGLTSTLFMNGFGVRFGTEQAERYIAAERKGMDFGLGLHAQSSPTVERMAYAHLERQFLENSKSRSTLPPKPLFLPIPDGNGAGFLISNSYPQWNLPEVDLKDPVQKNALLAHFRELSKKGKVFPFVDKTTALSYSRDTLKYFTNENISPVYKAVRAAFRESSNVLYVKSRTDNIIKEFPDYSALEIARAVKKARFGKTSFIPKNADIRRFLERGRE